MRRPLIRASMVTLLFVLLLSIALPTFVVVPPSSAAPLNEIPPPPTDAKLLSEGKPVEAEYSCISGNCYYPSYANDGDSYTTWSHSNNLDPVGELSWTVDLEAVYALTRLDVRWIRWPIYTLSISNDNLTFTPVFTRNAQTDGPSEILDVQARYVRITILEAPTYSFNGAYEIQIYGREVGPLDLTVTDSKGQPVDTLALNGDGWPATNATTGAVANPITVTVTFDPSAVETDFDTFQLRLGSLDEEQRFYTDFTGEDDIGCAEPIIEPYDPGNGYSYRYYLLQCDLRADPPQLLTIQRQIWIQPSAATTMPISARIVNLQSGTEVVTEASVDIPEAAIHPIVFLPGLGATIPPRYKGNADLLLAIGNRAANYTELYVALEKMGYDRNKTYFLFPYDWLRSTITASSHLATSLNKWDDIAAQVPWVQTNGQGADSVTFDLIGHSTGNLVARAYVQGPHWAGDSRDNVRRWVSIAGPLQGVTKGYQAYEGLLPELGPIDHLIEIWTRQRAFRTGYYKYFAKPPRLSTEAKYLFVHDPNEGLTILPEFLPTYGDYLRDGSGTTNPYGRLANTLLEDNNIVNGTVEDARSGAMTGKVFDPYLGNPHVVDTTYKKKPIPPGFSTTYYGLNTPAKMALLESRIGANNICIVYGGANVDERSNDTVAGFVVDTPPPTAPYWLNGERSTIDLVLGDNLITRTSADLENIWTVEPPSGNKFEIESELGRQSLHRTIVGEPISISATTQCLSQLKAPFLTQHYPRPGTDPAPTASAPPTPASVTNVEETDQMLLLYAPGPVELLLTDAQGQQLGYDPDSGSIVEEIPDAVYYRDTEEAAAYIFINGANTGDYDITITGTADGDYEVIGWYHDDTTLVDLVYEEGSTSAGATTSIDLTIPEDARTIPQAPDVQAGPNLNVTVGEAVTFAGAFSDINPDDSHAIGWDFGDRTTSAGTLTPEHTYIATGEYTATLTITDSTNFVVEDTLLVDVTGPALTPLSFTEPITYPSRVGSYSFLTVADGNNDTIPDIIGSNGIAGSGQVMSVLPGIGDGTFNTPEFIELDSVYSVAVADFDGDQLTDMALAHQVSLFILPGRGVGQWPRFEFDALRYESESFRSVITADFNGDGRPDLATSNIATRDVEIWYGNGDGTFQESVRYAVGALPFSLVSSDLNGDGLPDLMIANAGDNNISVLINMGDQFTAAATYPVGDYPMMVTAADFNGDGSPDLATANGQDDTISILFNDGTGQLQSALPVPLKQHPHSIVTGDLNSDGARDIIVGTNRTADILLGYGDGTFHTAHSYAIDGAVLSMDVADLNTDGNDDLVVLNMQYGEANVFLQR